MFLVETGYFGDIPMLTNLISILKFQFIRLPLKSPSYSDKVPQESKEAENAPTLCRQGPRQETTTGVLRHVEDG